MLQQIIRIGLLVTLFYGLQAKNLAGADQEKGSIKTGRFTLEEPELNLETGKLLATRTGAVLNLPTPTPSPAAKRATGNKKGPAVEAEASKAGDGSGPVKWDVYVPPKTTRGRLVGLFVFINAADSTWVPREYLPVLEERNLIWVSTEKAGNTVSPLFRWWMALDGLAQVCQRYAIDPARTYVAGTSGGGRASSRLAFVCPDAFAGGYFFCGVDYYPDRPALGLPVQPGFQGPNPQFLQAARSQCRYVLCTGSEDMNNHDTKSVCSSLLHDGFAAVKLQEIEGMGHSIPPAGDFKKGIEFLDAPLAAGAKAQYQKAQSLLKRKKPGDAWLAFAQAASHGAGEAFAADSQTQADILYKQYEKSLADVRALVVVNDPKARAALAQFKTQYGPLAQQEVLALTEQLKKPAKKS